MTNMPAHHLIPQQPTSNHYVFPRKSLYQSNSSINELQQLLTYKLGSQNPKTCKLAQTPIKIPRAPILGLDRIRQINIQKGYMSVKDTLNTTQHNHSQRNHSSKKKMEVISSSNSLRRIQPYHKVINYTPPKPTNNSQLRQRKTIENLLNPSQIQSINQKHINNHQVKSNLINFSNSSNTSSYFNYCSENNHQSRKIKVNLKKK